MTSASYLQCDIDWGYLQNNTSNWPGQLNNQSNLQAKGKRKFLYNKKLKRIAL